MVIRGNHVSSRWAHCKMSADFSDGSLSVSPQRPRCGSRRRRPARTRTVEHEMDDVWHEGSPESRILDRLMLVIRSSSDSIPLVFGTGGRIRQSLRKIDFSALESDRGFWTRCAERLGGSRQTEGRYEGSVYRIEVDSRAGLEPEREDTLCFFFVPLACRKRIEFSESIESIESDEARETEKEARKPSRNHVPV